MNVAADGDNRTTTVQAVDRARSTDRQGDTRIGESAAVEILLVFNNIPSAGPFAVFGLAGLCFAGRRRR